MTEDKLHFLKSLTIDIPALPGVYLMKNKAEKVIYVGKAKDLNKRVKSYFTGLKNKPSKVLYLINHIQKIDFIVTKTEVEAFLTEASLIKKFRPRYNVRLKDDKSYPYIKCDKSHDFPRFYLVRKVKNDGSEYFGPYTSGFFVREAIQFVNEFYKIRDCSDSFFKSRKRPCMSFQIGQCPAPCVEPVSLDSYNQQIKLALKFLSGKNSSLVKELKMKMQKASDDERFEAAARLRDHIRSLEKIWEKQVVISTKSDKNQDCIAYYGDERGVIIEVLHIRQGRLIGNRYQFIAKLNIHSEEETEKDWLVSFINQYYDENMVPDEILLPVSIGDDLEKLLIDVFSFRSGRTPKITHSLNGDKKKMMALAFKNAESHFKQQVDDFDKKINALHEIKRKLHLPELPIRIECFDISNFQGDQSVGSQVVFEHASPKKDDYRIYKVKSLEGPNDFDSMAEILERRLNHKEYDTPQLIMVDGGKGQLSAALKVLKKLEMQIPIVGIAKSRTLGEFNEQEIASTEERFFLPGRKNPIIFQASSLGQKILIQLRDEAHRFAITHHRKMRDKVLVSSELDSMKGVGEKTKEKLLKHFGSVFKIKQASVDELKALGISPKVIEEIKKSKS